MKPRKRIVLYFPRLIDPARGEASKHLLPLPLLAIASGPVSDGYDVVLIDANVFESDAEAHARVVEACDGALLYATTGILSYQVGDAYRCTRAVRARHPKLPSIIGGWFATAAPELQLETGLYDAVGLGQGELTFHEFVKAVDNGEPLDRIDGLALLRDGAVVRTNPRGAVGWDRLAPTPWRIIDWPTYRDQQLLPRAVRSRERMPPPPGFEDRPYTAISYHGSYGCPLPCTFCCSPEASGRRWKAVPGVRMAEEILELRERWGFDVVHFHDANWGVMEKRVREFGQTLLDRDARLHYFAYMQAASALAFKPDTLDVLAESGMYISLIGAEAGSDETMEMLAKPTRGDDNIEAALEFDRRGISLQASYILGFPGESEASMLQTIDQARRMAVEAPFAAPWVWQYHPIPGAALYAKAIELGFQPPKTLEQWGSFFDYKVDELWPGRVSARVKRMLRLYTYYTNLSNGLARGRIGVWERHAQKRLRDRDSYLRGWPLGSVEAKAFDVWWRLERRVRPRSDEFQRGWRSTRALELRRRRQTVSAS